MTLTTCTGRIKETASAKQVLADNVACLLLERRQKQCHPVSSNMETEASAHLEKSAHCSKESNYNLVRYNGVEPYNHANPNLIVWVGTYLPTYGKARVSKRVYLDYHLLFAGVIHLLVQIHQFPRGFEPALSSKTTSEKYNSSTTWRMGVLSLLWADADR
ncbi:hypothetical protein LZ31DRAFT_234592 [Colletotrichum somersetense]|nr:hypothetical protein LZ31DRAFT_234592 [Colletotrichum somersetense]